MTTTGNIWKQEHRGWSPDARTRPCDAERVGRLRWNSGNPAPDPLPSRCAGGGLRKHLLHFSLVLGGLCVAAASATQHLLGHSFRLPGAFYVAVAAAALVPLGAALGDNVFRIGMEQVVMVVAGWTQPSVRQGSAHSRSSAGHGDGGGCGYPHQVRHIRKPPHHQHASHADKEQHPDPYSYALPLIICVTLTSSLVCAGLVILFLWLSTPPPPPFYQRPLPLALMACAVVLVAIVYKQRIVSLLNQHTRGKEEKD